MKLRLLLPIIAVVLAAAVFLYIRYVPREATMLLVNGVIYTLDDRSPIVEAVAIEGDRIAATGTTSEITRRFTSATVIDLHGRPAYPGFTDAHAHVENLGAALMNLRLDGTRSAADVAARVSAAVGGVPRGGWLRGRGWDQNDWQVRAFPHRSTIDAVAPDVPVVLVRVDGHAIWINTAAMRIAGITAATPDPDGGKIVRDVRGEPTGVFVDNAADMVTGYIPQPGREERIQAIERAVHACLAVGLTEVHDMGVDSEEIGIYRTLIDQGRFPFRVYAAIGGAGKTWEHSLQTGPEVYRSRLTVRAIKLYADGALGSRGAALIEPYADDPGNRGLTLLSAAELHAVATTAIEHGFQVCVHAIGDRANHIVLDAFQDVLAAHRERARDARFRVEHAQVIAPGDISRFHELGVIPAMQPTHCTSDMPWAEDRLGPSRIAGAYAWRSLLSTGSIVPGGSDFPVESPDPLLGFYAAITRQDADGKPEGGWHPEQRMTREEALRSFTSWGAFAAFEEQTRGSLEEGKLADIVVLSDDIMIIPPPAILRTRVWMTIVGGEVVYTGDLLAGAHAGPR